MAIADDADSLSIAVHLLQQMTDAASYTLHTGKLLAIPIHNEECAETALRHAKSLGLRFDREVNGPHGRHFIFDAVKFTPPAPESKSHRTPA